MFNDLLNFDFERSSDEELKNWLRQAYPIIKAFLTAAHRFCTPKPVSCENCPQRNECEEQNTAKEDKTCLKLEPYLPTRYQGAGKREEHLGLLVEEFSEADSDIFEIGDNPDRVPKRAHRIIKSIRKTRSDEIFTLYERCSHIFTEEQWEVICLRFEYGMTFRSIGKMLDIEPSTASDRFQRGQKRLRAHYAKTKDKKFKK